jgi:hypothetical protein
VCAEGRRTRICRDVHRSNEKKEEKEKKFLTFER